MKPNEDKFKKEYDIKVAGFRRQASQEMSLFKNVIMKCLRQGVIDGKEAVTLKRISQNLTGYPANRSMILKDLGDVIKALDYKTGKSLSDSNMKLQGVILDLSELYDRLNDIRTKIASLAKEIKGL